MNYFSNVNEKERQHGVSILYSVNGEIEFCDKQILPDKTIYTISSITLDTETKEPDCMGKVIILLNGDDFISFYVPKEVPSLVLENKKEGSVIELHEQANMHIFSNRGVISIIPGTLVLNLKIRKLPSIEYHYDIDTIIK